MYKRAVILKTADCHAVLDKERNLKTKIVNTFSVIFSLCIADFVFLCQENIKFPSESERFFSSQSRST